MSYPAFSSDGINTPLTPAGFLSPSPRPSSTRGEGEDGSCIVVRGKWFVKSAPVTAAGFSAARSHLHPAVMGLR